MTNDRVAAGACLAAFFFGTLDVAAQGTEPQVPEKIGKDIRAFRVTGSPPRVDGRLDDEVWLLAQSIDDMVQNEPENMAAPGERTVIQVAYDDRYLYVAARMYTRDPGTITTALGRRDTFPPSDMLRLSFDTRHDHLTAYVFHVNPSGVQHDNNWYDDVRSTDDFDAVWDVETAITADGWTAELRIPFSQMRFSHTADTQTTWGFNVRRDIYSTGEFDRWVATPRGVQGFVSRFGHLVFDDRLTPPRRVEIVPYTTARRQDAPAAAAGHRIDGGLDMRLGIGTASTLAVTVNPDFGQVEQDPSVLNLSVFETFFPERRPFFLEDARAFSTNSQQFPMFHSRRIGARPRRIEVPDEDTVVSRPDQTTILGAAKLTGKASGWTYGVLSALTSREYAEVEITDTAADGTTRVSRGERLIEPLTSYSVARVQRDLLGASSSVGAMATSVVRDGDHDAFTGGLDFNIRWNRNLYRLEGQWVGTRAPISGDMRSGVGGVTRFNYSGKHFGLRGHVDHFSRDFRNADIGFFGSRPNKTNTEAGFGTGNPDPWGPFRSLWWFSNVGRGENGDGVVFNKWFNTGMDIEFPNFWYVGWNAGRNFEVLDDLDTRGGPPIVRPANAFYNVFMATDSRRTVRLQFNTGGDRNGVGGWNMRFGPTLTLQPSTTLQTSIGTSYNFGRTDAQWIENTDVDGDGTDDHVYGRLKRDVVDVTARATYSFSRNLTLQIYLQPFVAVGNYTDIRRLAQPSSYLFEPVTLGDNPDFNNTSLRSNTVLRWEYRPGSTLFFVWNVSTDDDANPGMFSPLSDLRRAFGAPGTHVFMVKVNVWLGL